MSRKFILLSFIKALLTNFEYAYKKTIDETGSSRKTVDEIIIKDPLMVNDRNSSQQIATDIAQCTRNHSVAAIIFSLGGYSGNYSHAFTDIIVSLYSTARPFNRDEQFLITNTKSWWIAKFKTLLEALSRYELTDIDDRHDILRFRSLTNGVKGRTNGELSIDPSTSPYSIKDFRQFLISYYSLKKITAAKIRDGDKRTPQLLIISRKRSVNTFSCRMQSLPCIITSLSSYNFLSSIISYKI
ncbi:hypothetical protein Peur_034635 [Populus x canadensis]